MRILMIRHGDPDYEHDSLTEIGRREAALLAKEAGSLNLGTALCRLLAGQGNGGIYVEKIKPFSQDVRLASGISRKA